MPDLTITRDRLNHESRIKGEDRPQTVEQAVRVAHELLTAVGVTLSPSKVTRLCRDFLRTNPPCTFRTYLARNAAPAVASLPLAPSRHGLEWVDPTGETATRNVDRERVSAHV
ncbi:hypothetical protein [Janibacter indicus]|uniref:hypothetical protein n=1 Tax=Janibacter indicus TaxID=857417 RepID=UPI003D9A25E3